MCAQLIHKLLIANRGEIALRIQRTALQLGIATVVVYSEADRDAPFVRGTDEAYCIGGPSPADSYLNAEAILEVARLSGADALHPGYGFLSERAVFAEQVQAAGIRWVGPTPESMRRLGDKRAARQLAAQVGVPVLGGFDGSYAELGELEAHAQKIGFPLLIKASAGGGGRGMRIVRAASELKDALASAEREALSAFGDGSLLLEQYVETARHIEFQILADSHGNTLHLFERECSLQRKYQKVWEESPSPVLTPVLRTRMGADAVKLAQAVGYTNAGTIEYLLDPAGNYYFLEMNTRLQVEHPVTEMVTGLDLVEWQLRIAEGQPLPYTQDSLTQKGYAVEVRLNAEDPANNFLPQTGKLHLLGKLDETEGVRWEMGVETGSEVSPWYDSMVGKLIVHADNRAEALRKLNYQLNHLTLLGLPTNREFLLACVQNAEIQAGNYHTRWIEEQLPTLTVPVAEGEMAALLILASLLEDRQPKFGLLHSFPSGWRNNGVAEESETITVAGETYTLQYTQSGKEARVSIGKATYTLRNWQNMTVAPYVVQIRVECSQRNLLGWITEDSAAGWVQLSGGPLATCKVHDRLPEPASQLAEGDYTAPMPGQIVRVVAQPGQEVSEGDPLVILSSMKMEQTVYARQAGTLQEVFVAEGQFVQSGTLLVQLS